MSSKRETGNTAGTVLPASGMGGKKNYAIYLLFVLLVAEVLSVTM